MGDSEHAQNARYSAMAPVCFKLAHCIECFTSTLGNWESIRNEKPILGTVAKTSNSIDGMAQ
jgi:hypothetical protein